MDTFAEGPENFYGYGPFFPPQPLPLRRGGMFSFLGGYVEAN
jgi:hypothetical protein